jgi:Cyclic nucleotide-binding domain
MRWASNLAATFEAGATRRLRGASRDMGLWARLPGLQDVTFFRENTHMRYSSTSQCGLQRIVSVSIRGRRVELKLIFPPEPRASRTRQALPREDPTAVNFWNSLDPAERYAFISVARERTFARGARLVREGEQANHVMVILSGWTRITVHENGRERVIAERGPGQLVGERGALRVNERSATVFALETVRALVMKTEDFASFIGAYPRVLDIVESQIYYRLTEEPTEHGRDDWPESVVLLGPAGCPSAEGSQQRMLAGENCTVLLTDVVGFGAHSRNDGDRRIIRRASLDMTRRSLGHVWEACISEDRGDGLLIVVPPRIPTTEVMERLHRELPGELRQHNRTYGNSVRIQLRVAVNVGPVMSDALGMSGEAIIRTARLLDAPVLKEVMASTGANLGIIASVFVYETVIRHAEGWTDPDKYEMVQVSVKESSMPAWMQLIDPNPHAPPVRGPLKLEPRSVPYLTRDASPTRGDAPAGPLT